MNFMKNNIAHLFQRLLPAAASLLVLASLHTHAITTSGVITSAETWSGTVLLTGDVTISPTGKLTIQPGTIIQSDPGADDQIGGADKSHIELIVEDGGSLSAIGTEDQPILFTSAVFAPDSHAPADWYGIRVNSSDVTLKYCTIEWGDLGITIGDLPRAGFYPQVEKCVIQDNRRIGALIGPSGLTLNGCVMRRNRWGLANPQAVGLQIGGVSVDESADYRLELVDCLLDANGDGMFLMGGEVTLSCRGSSLTGNTGNGCTIGASSLAGSTIFDHCAIGGNSGYGMNWSGGAIAVRDCVISNNSSVGMNLYGSEIMISNCQVTGNRENGITAYCVTSAEASAIVEGNSILNNALTGLSLRVDGPHFSIASNRIQDNQTGIDLWVGNPQSDGRVANNLIFQSLEYDLKSSFAFPIVADGNYWGEPTTTELKNRVRNLTKIYDSRDDAAVSQVVIRTWLDTPNAANIAPTIVERPASQTVYEGNSINLSVLVNGSAPTFQWFKDGKPIPNSNSPTLPLNSVKGSDSGIYTVRISNAAGTVTTDPATLKVNPVTDAAWLSLQTFAGVAIVGQVGKTYAIQYASNPDAAGNWTQWTTLTTLTLPSTPFVYVDPSSGGTAKRFYRAVLVP
jgi:hypothetical protein